MAICSVVARLEGIFLYAATAVRIAKYATAPTKVTVITRNPNTTVAVTHSIMSGSDCHTAASPETAALTPIHPPTASTVLGEAEASPSRLVAVVSTSAQTLVSTLLMFSFI